jgi:glycosyltransferase involved in cell wall biosynthesis
VPAADVDSWRAAGIVRPLGHVKDMAALLPEVDVMVLPSHYGEGVPRSLIEAAACGLPCVTTDAPGCREIVEDGVNGYLVPVRDAKALADSIRRLYVDADLRHSMGQAGREKVLREFDEKIVFEKTLAVYRELLPAT